MTFKRRSLVAYAGRAAEVQGVMPFTLPSGRAIDCLVLTYTGGPKGIVRVPVDRVADTVRRISKREAAHLDANIPPVVWAGASRMQKARAAAAARAADYGRMGGLAKAKAAAA